MTRLRQLIEQGRLLAKKCWTYYRAHFTPLGTVWLLLAIMVGIPVLWGCIRYIFSTDTRTDDQTLNEVFAPEDTTRSHHPELFDSTLVDHAQSSTTAPVTVTVSPASGDSTNASAPAPAEAQPVFDPELDTPIS